MSPLRFALACLVGTVGIGTLLRWALAGRGMLIGDFAHVRSAHSHLGYFGVLFPFVWLAWARAGHAVPRGRWLAVYAVGTAAATVDFGLRGYALVSIAGSTVVLGFWILSAWPHWRRVAGRDWMAPVFPAVLGSALAIPAVAVLSRRSDPAAGQWVHAFLTWLLLGVGVPTVLDRSGARPPAGWLHTLAVLGTGLALGPFPNPVTRGAMAIGGGLIAWAGLRAALRWELRGAWLGVGLGLVTVATGLLAWSPILAVAAIHFVMLGPVLGVLAWPETEAWTRWRPAYLGLVAAFAGCVSMTGWSPAVGWPVAAALTGTLVALVWVVRMWSGDKAG